MLGHFRLAGDVPRHAVAGRNLVQNAVVGARIRPGDDDLEVVLRQAEIGVEGVEDLGGVPDRHEHLRHAWLLRARLGFFATWIRTAAGAVMPGKGYCTLSLRP